MGKRRAEQLSNSKNPAFLHRHRSSLRWFPTTLLCQHASVAGGREFLSEARIALKERKLRLLDELAQIESAERTVQENLFFDIRRRGRRGKFLQTRRALG